MQRVPRYLEDDDIPEPGEPPTPVDKELQDLIVRFREKNKEYSKAFGVNELWVVFKEIGPVKNVGPYKCKIIGF